MQIRTGTARGRIARIAARARGRANLPLAAALVLSCLAGAACAAEPTAAAWRPVQMKFRLFPGNTLYACEPLEDKLELLLVAAGARDDAKAQVCNRHSATNILLAFSVAVPSEAGPVTEAFPAQWTPVTLERRHNLRAGRRRLALDPGDCDLVEQFARQVLPQFPIRDLKARSVCTPGGLSSPFRITYSVLAPAPGPEARQ